jgi:hypothetical protein
MTARRSSNDDQSPIPTDPSPTGESSGVVKSSMNFSGNTVPHYLPVELRPPAPPTPPAHAEDLPTKPEGPLLLETQPIPLVLCAICQDGMLLADLPEITVWSCGHWTRKKPQSIAESFQDMLRTTFQAGVAAATSGETFETWYQREVLQ